MWLRISSFILLALAVSGLVFPKSLAQTKPNEVVVLTANWCANCRRVVPIVKEAATQRGVAAVVIDVDSPAAPRQAKPYGINISGETLPVVYVIRQGQPTRVLDGKAYTYGQDDAVRGQILSQLGG